MAHNEKLTIRVREALECIAKGKERKMFRGISFMINKKMCISTGNDELMCRIDPAFNENAIKKTGCRAMIMKGREYKDYVYFKEDSIKTKKELNYWITLTLDFNKKLKAVKKECEINVYKCFNSSNK